MFASALELGHILGHDNQIILFSQHIVIRGIGNNSTLVTLLHGQSNTLVALFHFHKGFKKWLPDLGFGQCGRKPDPRSGWQRNGAGHHLHLTRAGEQIGLFHCVSGPVAGSFDRG